MHMHLQYSGWPLGDLGVIGNTIAFFRKDPPPCILGFFPCVLGKSKVRTGTSMQSYGTNQLQPANPERTLHCHTLAHVCMQKFERYITALRERSFGRIV